MQLDADAVEKLMINVDDFNYALEHDVKPVRYQPLSSSLKVLRMQFWS